MYDFLIGPMLALSLVVFIAGVAYRVYQFFSISEARPKPEANLPKDLARTVADREKDEYLRIDSAADILLKWKLRLKRTILGRAPGMSSVTIVFHTMLFLLPVVTVGHSILLDSYFGISLPTLSETTVDTLTLVFIIVIFFYLFRRIFVAKVRSVSTWRDYLALFATGAPFVTGYMAFHHWFDYKTVLYIHIICGELMLIAIPFTKLVHMPFFILSRFLIRYELGFGKGSRKWVENT